MDEQWVFYTHVADENHVCLSELITVFREDEWLCNFIFNNFGVAGNNAVYRLIKRIQISERQKAVHAAQETLRKGVTNERTT